MRQQPAQPSPALSPACPPSRNATQRSAAPRRFCSRVLFGLELAPTATSTCCLIACPALPSLINLPRVSAACVCTTVARMRLDQRLHPSVRSGPQVCVTSPTPSHHCILYRIVLSVPCSTTTVSIYRYIVFIWTPTMAPFERNGQLGDSFVRYCVAQSRRRSI
eukprot:COSAG06_NODE_2771_length_6311_cov_12.386671_5_plen_163_part_00